MRLFDRAAYGLIFVLTGWRIVVLDDPEQRVRTFLIGVAALIVYALVSAFILWPRYAPPYRSEDHDS